MKILVLNHEFPPVGGGASPVAFQLCRHLAHLGHHVDVITMRWSQSPNHEILGGVNIYRTPALRARPDICRTHELATYLPGALPTAVRLARRHRYDIIHCHFLVPGAPLAWLTSKITNTPFLVTCHGSDVPGYNPDRFGLAHKLIIPAWHFLVHRTPLLTTPSVALKSLIETTCPRARVKPIPNGIATDFFTPAADKTNQILMCSRILPRKGFQYVIDAVKDLQIPWQLHIVGDGPYLPELKRRAADAQIPITFHGWLDRDDPRFGQLYQTSSIFVLPSAAESFGMVVAEAMAASAAVIASDIPAHHEVLNDTGLYVRPTSVPDIRTAVLRLIDDPALRNRLAQQARQRVCQLFDWRVVAQQYLDCYHEVINAAQKS